MNLDKIIIWGHELHNHTHSYIHNAFYKTFKYLNYNVYWFNEDGDNNYPDNTNNTKIDFNNALYIVHGLESENLPLNNTSFYIGHNVEWTGTEFKIPKSHVLMNSEKGIPHQNIMTLQVYTKECLNYKSYKNIKYHIYVEDGSCIFMPWATDLLPYEIDNNIKQIKKFNIKKISNFIGMPLGHWDIFKDECKEHGIEYKNYGGTFDKTSKRNKSIQENMVLIQESILAPALQTDWQIDNHYIPCRIFKNISYGKMGMTNNEAVYNLFNKKILYSNDIPELVKQGLEFDKKENKFDKIKELMIEVRDNHTYINRIHFILDFIKEKKNIIVKKDNSAQDLLNIFNK